MINFKRSNYYFAVDQIKELIEATNDEVGPYKEEVFSPDWDTYAWLEDTGGLAVFTAHDEEELIGYMVFVLGNHNYYRDMFVAQSDIIYVVPEHRGETAKEFMEFVDNELYLEGVQGINISMSLEKDFSGLLEHLGYKKTALTCSKYLGDI